MKAIIFFIFAFISFNAMAEVREEFDKSTGVVYREYEAKYDSGTRYFSVGSILGPSRKNASYVLRFSQFSKTRQYQNCLIGFFINGERMDVGPSEYDTDVTSNGYVLEIVRIYPSASIVAAAGNAKTVQYRICEDRFDLWAEDIQGLRELVSKTK